MKLMRVSLAALCGSLLLLASSVAAGEPQVVKLWPGKPPGDEQLTLPAEADMTKPKDRPVAGRPVIRLGNVSTPTIAIYRPSKETDTGTAVVICPGGGHNILAYDLEGTEVATWLNSLGVTGIVLKYRVPGRSKEHRGAAAVQDAQRAMGLVRQRASEWSINPRRIGILGFSAGGEVAALTSLTAERTYSAIDEADKVSSRPDFSVLIYPAYLTEKEGDQMRLRRGITVDKSAPPTFLVHTFDDGVSPENSLLLCVALKRAGVPAELHLYDRGGHGYGLRATDTPVTSWPKPCEQWLRTRGLLTK